MLFFHDGGEVWNGKIWHNNSVPNYATGFQGPLPFCSVSFLALLACTFPLCPALPLWQAPSLQEMTATIQTPIGNNNHSQSILLAPPSGDFVPNFPVVCKNWCQIFSAPSFAIPNFACTTTPPPPPGVSHTALWVPLQVRLHIPWNAPLCFHSCDWGSVPTPPSCVGSPPPHICVRAKSSEFTEAFNNG